MGWQHSHTHRHTLPHLQALQLGWIGYAIFFGRPSTYAFTEGAATLRKESFTAITVVYWSGILLLLIALSWGIIFPTSIQHFWSLIGVIAITFSFCPLNISFSFRSLKHWCQLVLGRIHLHMLQNSEKSRDVISSHIFTPSSQLATAQCPLGSRKMISLTAGYLHTMKHYCYLLLPSFFSQVFVIISQITD